MDDLSTIQDYSLIDSFLKQNLQNYRKQLFGNFDDKTGYFEEVQPEEEPIIQEEEEEVNEGFDNAIENDEEAIYDDLFGTLQADYPAYGIGKVPSFSGGRGSQSSSGAMPGFRSLGSQISDKESQGKYTATNPNSSATGKYQFLWGDWGDDIKRFTGVKSQKEFLNSPEAQEKYYDFYEKSYLLPEVQKIKKEIKTSLTDTQLAKLVHFRGEGGARKWLKGQVSDKPESYNMSTSGYIKQAGGNIARTAQQQYVGLNDQSLDDLMMPLQGTNTIRGLDSGEPVNVMDEIGNQEILYGPQHTTQTQGNVFEQRMKRGGYVKRYRI